MQITDLNGDKIEVTDLQLAIMQADDYRHYRVTNPSAHQCHLYVYWEDLYQKLVAMQEQLSKQ